MRPELADLIDRMSIDEPVMNSDESVSWHAFREAEQLADPELLAELAVALDGEPSQRMRQALVFTIGKIGKNIGQTTAKLALLRQIEVVKDADTLSAVFDRLAEGSKLEDHEAESILRFLADPRCQVRHSAINVLANSATSFPEDALLKFLEGTTDKFNLIYGHEALRSIGTRKALPQLERGRRSSIRVVKRSAELAIQEIQERCGEGIIP